MKKFWSFIVRAIETALVTVVGIALFPVILIINGLNGFSPKDFFTGLYILFKEDPNQNEEES